MSEITLQPVARSFLESIAAGLHIEPERLKAAEGALPPSHVAKRALDNLARGCSPLWCVPFNIIDESGTLVVGGCGFKGAPDRGEVEVGYGIAAACLQRGYGSRGVRLLLEMAKVAGILKVIAHIAPGNAASAALAHSLGFSQGAAAVDSDGENVVRWVWKCDT